MKRRLSEEHKREFVSQFLRSGMTAAEFSRQKGISDTAICNWRKKFSNISIEMPAKRVVIPIDAVTPAMRLLRLCGEDVSQNGLDVAIELLKMLDATDCI